MGQLRTDAWAASRRSASPARPRPRPGGPAGWSPRSCSRTPARPGSPPGPSPAAVMTRARPGSSRNPCSRHRPGGDRRPGSSELGVVTVAPAGMDGLDRLVDLVGGARGELSRSGPSRDSSARSAPASSWPRAAARSRSPWLTSTGSPAGRLPVRASQPPATRTQGSPGRPRQRSRTVRLSARPSRTGAPTSRAQRTPAWPSSRALSSAVASSRGVGSAARSIQWAPPGRVR